MIDTIMTVVNRCRSTLAGLIWKVSDFFGWLGEKVSPRYV